MEKKAILGLVALVVLLIASFYLLFTVLIPQNFIELLGNFVSGETLSQDILYALDKSLFKFWILSSVVLMAWIGITYSLVRIITLKPTKILEKNLKEIEQGNMLKKLPEDHEGSIRIIAHSVNKILTNTKKIMGDVLTAAEKTTIYAEELLTNAEETNHSAEEIAITISEIAQGIEQVSSAAAQTRDNTIEMVESSQSIVEFASNTRDESLEMEKTVSESIRNLENLVERINENAQTNNRLSKEVTVLENHAEQISSITMEVTGISEQTNLLALNAAIEAARAGEQGRGFAVVAEEVRKLAEQSTSSANRIQNLVTSIISQIGLVVETMQAQASSAREDVKLADSSKEEFSKINQVTLATVQSVEKILELAKNQVSKVREIEAFMEDIVASAQQSSAGTEQTAAAAQQQSAAMEQVFQSIKNLNKIAQEMDETFAEYKKGLALGEKEKVKVEKARSIMERLIKNTAFKEDNLSTIIKLFKENISEDTGFEFFAYVDSKGDIKVASQDVAITNIAHRTYFIEAMKGKTYQSQPYISSATEDFCITISMPVGDHNGNVIGVLSGDINLKV